MSKVGDSDVDANHGNRPGFNSPLVVLSIAFLVISYLTRVVRIFNPTAGLARSWLKDIPRKAMRRWYCYASRKAGEEPRPALRRIWNVFSFILAVVYTILKASYYVGESMLWEVCSFVPLISLLLS